MHKYNVPDINIYSPINTSRLASWDTTGNSESLEKINNLGNVTKIY